MPQTQEEQPPHLQLRTHNGACQVIELWHYKQYTPGYVVKVISDHGVRGTYEAEYWVHTPRDQTDLLHALEKVADSHILPVLPPNKRCDHCTNTVLSTDASIITFKHSETGKEEHICTICYDRRETALRAEETAQRRRQGALDGWGIRRGKQETYKKEGEDAR